ncbi:MAG: hypothetical protein ACREOV_11890 [Candidatus Dormibacteraceae bacterium]
MQARDRVGRSVGYAILIVLSAGSVAPLVWMVHTSPRCGRATRSSRA